MRGLAATGRMTALAAMVLLTGACSSGQAVDTGPLGDGGTGGGLCAPVRPGGVLSYGITYLANRGSSPARIVGVRLVRDRKIALITSYVVPILANFDYGTSAGYPPPADLQRGIDWSRSRRAVGAELPPMHGRQHDNLVVVLKPEGQVGLAHAINVSYTENGHSYQLQTHIWLQLISGTRCP